MPDKPTVLSSAIVARSRIFQIERIELRFANGVETSYERLVGSAYGAVLVVPVLDADRLLLIREYAAGTDRYELGFPKGRVEPGEDHVDAANRELMEETGYGAERLEHLHALTLAPGYLSHVTHLVLARDLYPRRLEGDEPEPIEVVPWPIGEVDALLARPDFTEGRSIAALFLALERLKTKDSMQ